MQNVPQLPEVVVEVTDLEGDYEAKWSRVEAGVWGINRSDEDDEVSTARVHVMVSDRLVRKIWANALFMSSNVVKVTAPFVEEIGEWAFARTINLCHVTYSPDVVAKPGAFQSCPSLPVLAASVGFEPDTGDCTTVGMTLP